MSAGGVPGWAAQPPQGGAGKDSEERPGDGGVAGSGGASGSGGITNEAGAAGQYAGSGGIGEGGSAGSAGAAGNVGVAGDDSGGGPGWQRRSCDQLDLPCGMDQDSCCAVRSIPGGRFPFGAASEPPAVLSRVSGFWLDRYEVTVSRFRGFLQDYDAFRASGELAAGAGAHPRIAGTGWDPSWEATATSDPSLELLARDRAGLQAAVSACMTIPLSTVMAAQPVNCVTWYEAQAFCIWDGGRLPTELEWQYAAAGGAENRTYPWGNQPPTPGYARYACNPRLPDHPCPLPSVGTYPLGQSLWGQLDMAGSVFEWTFDAFDNVPHPIPCHDCARVVPPPGSDNPRIIRGGGYTSPDVELPVTWRGSLPNAVRLPQQGFRCAYDAAQE